MSKILLIEDEEAIRRVLKKILLEEDASHEVHEAADGKQGIATFGSGEWDLVFCDIKMPHMDGVEVLEQMMAINAEVPVIMISGHGDINTAVHCLKLGAFDYLPKPPDLNRLLNTVRNALERKTLIQEVKTLKKKVSKKFQMIKEPNTPMKISPAQSGTTVPARLPPRSTSAPNISGLSEPRSANGRKNRVAIDMP